MARRTLTLAAVMLAGLIGEASAVSQATSQATAALAADFLGLAPFPQPPTPAEDALEIRLGYGIYHGSHENKTGLNVWKGYVSINGGENRMVFLLLLLLGSRAPTRLLSSEFLTFQYRVCGPARQRPTVEGAAAAEH